MNWSKVCKTVFAVILFSAALSFALPARAQQVLLVADAQLNSAAPTTNYGVTPSLAVNSTNSVVLRYDLTDILPTGVTSSQVSKARLIIFPNSVTTKGPFSIYALTAGFGEGTVTYANKPGIAASAAATATISGAYDPIEIQVTSLVQGWIKDSTTNHGLEIIASGTTNFAIDSKENTGTSHPTVLVIDLTGPVGPTGATGPQGPQGPQGPAGAAGLTSVSTDSNFTGNGTSGSPLALAANVSLLGTLTTADQILTDSEDAISAVSATTSYIDGNGVFGYAPGSDGYGVFADGGYFGIYAEGTNKAGDFAGDVYVSGTLSKAGGSFKIDDPIDPENKYLSHSFVESPDMMNIYNGNVVTDNSGTAVVTMPDWFDSLNRDFRYQLTPIGQQAQAWIATEIENKQFSIRTDKPNVKVSWMVTGIRQDAWANAHRIPVEEEKTDSDKGHYLHPELFGHAGEAVAGEPALHPKPTRPTQR
jgi:hypothetical protein